jgi:hypothetical protein
LLSLEDNGLHTRRSVVSDLRVLRHRSRPILLCALAIALTIAGCSEEKSATGPAGGTTLRLESFGASPLVFAPGDTTRLAVRVVRGSGDGVAVSGATVQFAEVGVPFGSPGTATSGLCDPAAVLTDAQGWAYTTYRSHGARSGQIDMKAGCGTAVGYLSLLVTSGSTGTGTRIEVSAPETTLPADGQSTVTLTLRVTRDGVAVSGQSLKLVAGEFFEDRDHSGDYDAGDRVVIDSDGDTQWDALGSVTSPVTTGGDGTATAVYTAGLSEGDVFIKVTADTVATDFALELHSAQTTLTLGASAMESWADGLSEIEVTAEIRDESGQALAGKLVRFTAGEPFTDADGDGFYTLETDSFTDLNESGEWDVMGAITSSATTGADGRATATYRAGRSPGTATIYASTRERGNTLAVRLMSLPRVALAECSWSRETLYANGISEATLHVRLLDVNGSPIPGKEVALEAAAGTIPASAVADAQGVFETVYRAPLVAGEVAITLAAESWTQAVPMTILPLPALLSIELTADREEICLAGSGGIDRATILAECLQQDGTPAPEGIPIDFTISTGPSGGEWIEAGGEPIASRLTNASGSTSAVLRAGTVPGIVRVTASSGGVERALDLAISVGPAAAISLYPTDAELASWEQTTIHVTVKDAYNNPVADGTRVQFEVDEGLIEGDGGQGSSVTTGGQATATYYSLSPEAGGDGRAEIVARAQPDGVEGRTSVSIPMAAETVRVMTVAADPTELKVQGQANADQSVITAACFLRPDVPAPAGIPVTFTLANGPGGGEGFSGGGSAAVVETNAAGVAQAMLQSGTRSGPLHVRVDAGESAKDLYLGISAGPPAGVHCWPARGTCAPGDTVEVFAVVDDAYNNPVVDGTIVYFTVDHGFIFTENGSGTAPTDGGMVTAFYIALNDETTYAHATITCATEGGVEGETTVQLTAPVTPPDPGPIARIVLIPTRTEIGVHGTGATEQCEIYALCYDAENEPVGREREVSFEIIAGPGGGEALAGEDWGPVTVLTDDTSRASITLSSGTISGTVLVQASAGELATQSAPVSIAAGPPVYISVGTDPLNIRGWDVVGAQSDILAIVSDTYNNPVSDGTTIYLTCDEGIVRGWDGSLGSATTLGGIARGTYLSGLPRLDGRVLISASTAGGTVLGTGGLISSGGAASVTFVSPAPPVTLMADGDDEVRVMVEVLDINGNFVLGGTGVEFYTTLGQIDETAVTADGVAGSIARATLRSETLGRDYAYSVPDNGIGGTATVVGSAGLGGAYSDELAVDFLTGPAYRLNSRIEIDNEVAVGGTLSFEVLIQDRYSNPLGGHALQISATGGGVVTPTATTDTWGAASGLLFTAPASDTTCVITVTDTDPGYGGITLTETVAVN